MTLANLLYPCEGWLGTSCFSTFNYFAVASLRCLPLCMWVFVCVTECVFLLSLPSLWSQWQRLPMDLWAAARVISHTLWCSCSTWCPSPECSTSSNCSLDLGSYPVSCTALNPQTLPVTRHNSLFNIGSGHRCFNTELSKKTVNFKQFYFTKIFWQNLLQ